MPASEVPAACIPWYACWRRINTVRSGSPTSDQYRRTILVALSIESEPPLVRNTFASGIGASCATRSASASVGALVRSPKVEYDASSAIWARAASAISLLPCPTLQNHSPAVASTYRLPSASQTCDPSPRTSESPPNASTEAMSANGCQKLVISEMFPGRRLRPRCLRDRLHEDTCRAMGLPAVADVPELGIDRSTPILRD